jgi:transketolase
MPIFSEKLDALSINTIRFLSVDAVQKAKSGHPGMPMGCAPIAFVLYSKYMKHNPENPKWFNRDRFILSAGHGSMLLYSTLHLCGYDIPLDQLKQFRQWKSITPGHPEYGLTPGIETTTGPLGQGLSNAVGMAIAEEYLASVFNKDDIKLLDHYIYGICSDGDLMEGISHEVGSLAGHLKLGKLIFFYDNNGITIDGSTSLTFTDDVGKRFEAYGWHVQHIEDVNDLNRIEETIKAAQNETSKPSLIVTKTHIGYGSPHKQDSAEAHGSPLGEEEVKLTKKKFGWDENKTFFIPAEVKKLFEKVKLEGANYNKLWDELFLKYKKKYPGDANKFVSWMKGDIGNEWKTKLPRFKDEGKKISTRSASGQVINALAQSLPNLIGGSADLTPSNDTLITSSHNFSPESRDGRYFHFGIREHGMAGVLNGMAIYGGVIPYGGTFLIFSDYLRPAIRLGAISGIRPIYVFTHDSIGLGEDGPTHQPIEHLAALRAIPKLIVIRPADANETTFAWQAALEHQGSPVALILTRQGLPVLDAADYPFTRELLKGAYILKDCEGHPELILMASGSEVSITLEAGKELESDGFRVRVISFPSWELFDEQPAEYRDRILPPHTKVRIAVEAGVSQGWKKYVGNKGVVIGIDRFGASAPGNIVMEEYGFTKDKIVEASKALLNKLMFK